MNIVQLPIAGITLKSTSNEPASTIPSDGEANFASLLGGILSEVEGEGQSENLALKPVIEHILLMLSGNGNDRGMTKTEISGLEDLSGRLGEKLLELVAEATGDGNTGIDRKELLSILDDFVADLAGDEVDPGVKKVLVDLFAGAKEIVSGEKLEKGDLLSGLPEKTKSKLHLLLAESGRGMNQDEKVLIQFKLVSNLLGAVHPRADGAGTTANQAANAVRSGAGIGDRLPMVNHPLSEVPGISVRSEHSPVFKGELVPGEGNMASKEPGLKLVIDQSMPNADMNSMEKEIPVVKPQGDVATSTPGALEGVSGQKSATPQGHVAGLDNVKHMEAGARNVEVNIPKEPQGQPFKVASDSSGADQEALDLALGKKTQNTAESAFGSLQSGEQGLDSSSGRPSDAGNIGHIYSHSQAPEAKASFAQEVTNSGQEPAKTASANRDFINQVVEKFEVLIEDGVSEAKVQLRPRHLGELKIHLAIENGTMKAVLDASTHQAKEMLESNLAALKQSLESQGIQVKEFSVSVGQQRENHGHNNRFGRGRHAGLKDMGTNPGQIQMQAVRSMQGLGGDKVVNYLA